MFVHRWQTAPSPGAITMVEVNLKRSFSSGEWEKGVAIKDNVIIVEKSGHLANVCPSKCVHLENSEIEAPSLKSWGGGGGGETMQTKH